MVFSLLLPGTMPVASAKPLPVGEEGLGITTPASIMIYDYFTQPASSQVSVVVALHLEDKYDWSVAKNLDYRLILTDGDNEIDVVDKLVDAHKNFDNVDSFNGAFLLGTFSKGIIGPDYNIIIEGYNDQGIAIRELSGPFKIYDYDNEIKTNIKDGNLFVEADITALGIEINEESKLKLIIEDSQEKLIAQGLADYWQGEKDSGIYSFEVYYSAQSVKANLDLLTHNIAPGSYTVTLVVDDGVPIELGKVLGASRMKVEIEAEDYIIKGQRSFSAHIETENVPNKDYLKIILVEEIEGEDVLIAEVKETAYVDTDLDIDDNKVEWIARFEVVEGQSLGKGKMYYFKVAAEDGQSPQYIASLRVTDQLVMVDIDYSRYEESIISLEIGNFEMESEYTASVTNYYLEEQGMAKGVLNGNKLSFTFKNDDQSLFQFYEEDYYEIIIHEMTDDGETDRTYINFAIEAITNGEGFIERIMPRNFPLGSGIYKQEIDIYLGDLSEEDIKAITLVEVADQSNVIGHIDLPNASFEWDNWEGVDYLTVSANCIVDEKAVIGKAYGYLIETFDGIEISTKSEWNFVYFTDEVSFGNMAVKGQTHYYQGWYPTSYLPAATKEIALTLNDMLNVTDMSELDLFIRDKSDEIVAVLDPETLQLNPSSNIINQADVLIKLLPDKAFKENEQYRLTLSYGGKEHTHKNLEFSHRTLVGNMEIMDDGMIEKDQKQFDMILDGTLNLKPQDAQILLIKKTDYEDENFDQVIFVDATFTKDQEIENAGDYAVKVTLKEPLELGEYKVMFQQGDYLYEGQGEYTEYCPVLSVTDRALVIKSTKYTYKDNVLTEYELSAINLDTNATYDVYVYPKNHEMIRAAFRMGSSPDELDARALVLKLDRVQINDQGNIIFTPEALKELDSGDYELFFEMNKRIIGQGNLAIRKIDMWQPILTPEFFIEGGRETIDKNEVSLQIIPKGYSQVRVAKSLEELSQKAYEPLSKQEIAEGLALKQVNLSNGYGEKTIYIQLKYKTGKESQVLSNTITLVAPVKPVTPGGGTGGTTGGGSSPSKAENTSDEEGIVTVAPETITTETTANRVKATVAKDNTLKAIDQAAKEAKANTRPQIVITLPSIKDANMSVVMPTDVIKAAKENKVDLVIQSKEINYTIPFESLRNLAIQAGESIEFSSIEVIGQAIQGKKENEHVQKVIDFELIVRSADGSRRNITQFDGPIEVKISIKGLGDPERLGIYYLNEEDGILEFISKEVRDGFIIMKTNHYSKYAIIEADSHGEEAEQIKPTITFTDIENHWAQTSIEVAAAKGIISGYPDGTFKPNKHLTRAEFVSMMNALLALEPVTYAGEFTDVQVGQWFANSIATAVANGLVSGYPDGLFNPNGKITRAEMMSIISKTIQNSNLSPDEVDTILSPYADKDQIAPWAKEAIATVVKAGLIAGIDSKVQDQGESTRAQAAAVIDRIINK